MQDAIPDATDPHRHLSHRSREEILQSGFSSTWIQLMAITKAPGVTDLGQGAPNFEGCAAARHEAARALTDSIPLNQYSPVPGIPALGEALAKHYSPLLGRQLEPAKEVLVTSGATEGLYNAIHAVIGPGDRAVIFEPFFPWYLPCIRQAGGTAVVLPLEDRGPSEGFHVPLARLKEVLAEGPVKAVILNTPHNPTGMLLDRETLEAVAALAIQHDFVVLSDEAYEAQVFAPATHVRIASLPGMFSRTLTLCTASKIFSLTGWRVGWILGPEVLVAACRTIHSYTSYCAPTPLQAGIAAALNADPNYGQRMADLMSDNAKILSDALRDVGLKPYIVKGGYFLVADIRSTGLSDVDFVKALAKHAKVGVAPLSVFCQSPDPFKHLIRVAVCKDSATIQEAATRIRAADFGQMKAEYDAGSGI